MSNSRFGEKNIWFGKIKDLEYRENISATLTEYYRTHSVTAETKEKISKNISVPVRLTCKVPCLSYPKIL